MNVELIIINSVCRDKYVWEDIIIMLLLKHELHVKYWHRDVLS